MKILFDQGTPAPLRRHLAGHHVETAFEKGWDQLDNGDLIAAAEAGGFDALVTTDKNLRYQQNLIGRHIAVAVLPTTNWLKIRAQVSLVAAAIDRLKAGDYAEVLLAPPPGSAS